MTTKKLGLGLVVAASVFFLIVLASYLPQYSPAILVNLLNNNLSDWTSGNVTSSGNESQADSSFTSFTGHADLTSGNESEAEAACPTKPIDFRSHGSTRQQYVPVCSGEAHLELAEVNTTWLPVLNRSDPCLPRLIARHCTDGKRIPNVLHHVWLGPRSFSFIHLLSYLSVKFQNPCLVLVHSNMLPSGPLWEYYLHQQPRALQVLTIPPNSILGNKITKVEHQADILRIQALIDFGGIYMDSDTMLLRNVDELRNYSMVNSYEDPGNVACSTLMAAPQATFLKIWLDSYHDFHTDEWATHSVRVPALLIQRYPELVHNVGNRFIGPGFQHYQLYHDGDYDWSGDFTIHVYARFDKHVYDTQNVLWMNNTVASVARHVLYGRRHRCPGFKTG